MKDQRIAELDKMLKAALDENKKNNIDDKEFHIKKIKALESDIQLRDQKINELNNINANHLKSIDALKKSLEQSRNESLNAKNYCSEISIQNNRLSEQNKETIQDRTYRNSLPISKPIQGYQSFNTLAIGEKVNYIKSNWSFVTNYSQLVECYLSNDSKYLFICIVYIGKCKQMVTLIKFVSFILDRNILKRL